MSIETDGLSDAEKAYFDSRGEADPSADESTASEADFEAEEIEEVGPEEDEGAEDAPKPAKTVPLAALTKERAAAKELKAKLAEIERRAAVYEDRWNQILQAQQAAEAQKQAAPVDEDPEPDPNQDIFAHNAWLKRQLQKTQQTFQQRQQEEQRARQEAELETKVWEHWEQSAKGFAAKTPDFGDAAGYLATLRTNQLLALGHSEASANQVINAELKSAVISAAQSGRDIAEMVYEYAQKSGYTRKQARPAAEETIERVEKGLQASTTLSAGGGAPQRAPTKAADVANMSEREFSAWMKKHGEAGFKRLMGG